MREDVEIELSQEELDYLEQNVSGNDCETDDGCSFSKIAHKIHGELLDKLRHPPAGGILSAVLVLEVCVVSVDTGVLQTRSLDSLAEFIKALQNNGLHPTLSDRAYYNVRVRGTPETILNILHSPMVVSGVYPGEHDEQPQ